MNAQLNFQQFVKDNQGNLISFLHNDTLISKVVVDICGEYFTCKSSVSDCKIIGFYYFSDCKMFEKKHPLIEVLERNRFVVIKTFDIYEFIEYISGESGSFICKPLNKSYPNVIVTKLNSDIQEVWATVHTKYTKVYPYQVFSSIDKVINDSEKVNTTLEKLNNSFDNIFKNVDKNDGHFEESYPNGKYKRTGFYKNGKLHGVYKEWFESGKPSLYIKYNEDKIDGEYILYNKDATIKLYQLVKGDIRADIEIGNEQDFYKCYYLNPFLCKFLGLNIDKKYPKNNIIKSVFSYCFNLVNPKDKTEIIPDEKLDYLIGGEFGKRITFTELQKILNKYFCSPDEIPDNNKIQYQLIQDHAEKFVEIEYCFREYAPNTITKFLDALGNIKKSHFSLEKLEDFRTIFEELKDELLPQIQNFKEDIQLQALLKRFIEFVILVSQNSSARDYAELLLEHVNDLMTEDGKKEYDDQFNN